MGRVCAPVCSTPISIICHSVRLLEEIMAILSFFWIPNRNKALEIVLAFSIYSFVEVFTHWPFCLVTKASCRLYFSSWWYGKSKSLLIGVIMMVILLQIK